MRVLRSTDPKRFELIDDGEDVSFIDYAVREGNLWLLDTELSARHQRLGVSDFFVRKVFEYLRSESQPVVVKCPFIAAWLRRHPEFQDLAPTTSH